jgi:hypothetical protein
MKIRLTIAVIVFLVIALIIALCLTARKPLSEKPTCSNTDENLHEPINMTIADAILASFECLNIVYSTIYYIFILGNGLVSFPMIFIRYTETSINLKNLVKEFVRIKKNYELSVNKFVKNGSFLIDICEKVKKCENCPQQLQEYCDQLINTIESYNEEDFTQYNDFIGDNQEIFTDCIEKYGTNYVSLYPLTELSNLYVKYVKKYYLDSYKQKVLLLRYYLDIKKNGNTYGGYTIFYRNEKIKEKIRQRNVEQNNNDNKLLLIEPKQYSRVIQILTKVIGYVFFAVSFGIFLIHFFHIILLFMEKKLGFKEVVSKDQPQLAIFSFSIYFVYIIICSFHSFKSFQRFDDYILVNKNSDKFIMANNISFLNKILFGLFYHWIFFLLILNGDQKTDDPVNGVINTVKCVKQFSNITLFYDTFQNIYTIKYVYSFVLVFGLMFFIIVSVLKLFNIHFKQMVSLIENKEVYELYEQNNDSNEQGSNAFLTDENVLYCIERFEKEFYNDIIDMQT